MSEGLRLIIGCDDAGLHLKDVLLADLRADTRVSEVTDVSVIAGEDQPYPHVAARACQLIVDGRADRAVLICGTGIGMSIAANKVKGIRAANVSDTFSAERSILSNNAQVLCLGERVIGPELARRILAEWLGYHFDEQSKSAAKVAVISAYENPGGSSSTKETPGG